jgi:hypothetical protein
VPRYASAQHIDAISQNLTSSGLAFMSRPRPPTMSGLRGSSAVGNGERAVALAPVVGSVGRNDG